MSVVSGHVVATGKSFAIVAARWNEFFGDRLVEGAVQELVRHGAAREDITVYRCPGAFELPAVADKVARKGRVDAIVCLGVLIRGATPHFDYISSTVTAQIARVGLERGVPVSYGVLTCDTLDQTIERSGSKAGNKGAEAALAALEMANLYEAIEES
ncbi:MAG: 6,7-dimethyl-8-ribityllumazine synthase [Myxococcota bacterium]